MKRSFDEVEAIAQRVKNGERQSAIAREIGVSTTRLSGMLCDHACIVGRHEAYPELIGIPYQIGWWLIHRELTTKKQVREAIMAGRISPGNDACYNYGPVKHRLLCEWAGVPDPYPRRVPCPHCHGSGKVAAG